jgi:DNA gyrase/topoisomerase IV subunit B
MQTFKYKENLNECMATITINIQNEVSEKFREIVKKEKGEGKGIIGKAIEEALKMWIKEKEEEEIVQRQLEYLKKGFKTGKLKKYKREELYDRKF